MTRAATALLAMLVLGACAPATSPSASTARPLAAAVVASPDPDGLDVPERGRVLFVSTVAGGVTGLEKAPQRAVDFLLGQTLYARFDLPLSFAAYTEARGLDDFVLRVKVAQSDTGWSTVCAHTLTPHHPRSLEVALFADARVPAEIDCTAEMVNHLSGIAGGAVTMVSIEIEGTSRTVGIRKRMLAHDQLDLGITQLPDQLERFALEDRQLRSQLLQRDVAVAGSRMPALDQRALAAMRSSGRAEEDPAVRAVITSADWHYARDVRSHRSVDRFVLGVATVRTGSGCHLRDVLLTESIDGRDGPAPLRADFLPFSTASIPVACGSAPPS